MFFVYFLGTSLIYLFLLRIVLSRSKYKFRFPLLKYAAVFVVIYIIASFLSDHFYTSLWGYYTRFNGGLVSVLVFFGLYVVAVNVLKREDVSFLVNVVLVSVIPISIYGILQHYSIFEDFWKVDSALRVFSTFGQPNWLAAYLAMVLPVALYKTLNDHDRRRIWAVLFLVGFSCLWFTYSLSGLAGLAGGIVLFVYLNLTLVKDELKTAAVILVTAALIAVLNPGIYTQRLKDVFVDVQKTISVYTVVWAQEENIISDPGFIRTGLWKGTVRLALSSPKIFLIGTGPGTFPYEFSGFREPSLNYSSEWDFIFNKPHNYYLELFSEIGILGLASYLILMLKTIKRPHPYLVPALTGFYITNIFGWPVVSTALLFWMFLAFLEIEYESN